MRKKVLPFIILVLVCATPILAQAQTYKIKVTIDGLTEGDCYLANYYGKQNAAKDTATVQPDGSMVFEGNKKLDNGVYMIVNPNKTNFFEIIIGPDDQDFEIKADTTFSPLSVTVLGSKDNQYFFAFRKLAATNGRRAFEISQELKEEKNQKKKEKLEAERATLEDRIVEYRDSLMVEAEGLFIAKVFNAMRDVKIPAPPTLEDGTKDSAFSYRYYRQHYWDNFDLGEDGMVRTPFFHSKMERYFTQMFPSSPDTLIKAIDDFLTEVEAKGGKEIFHYVVWWTTKHFEDSKRVCFDKVLYHMAKDYYCAGKAFWADSALQAKMCDHVNKVDEIQCDLIAPKMTLIDSALNAHPLHAIDAPVTVIIFWDHECGHCKKEIPKLQEMYENELKEKGVFIYSVYTQDDWEGWKKFIREKKLTFLNVGNLFGQSDYRKHYYFVGTPEVYVLDKDKKIRFKKIGVESIPSIADFLIKEQEKEKE